MATTHLEKQSCRPASRMSYVSLYAFKNVSSGLIVPHEQYQLQEQIWPFSDLWGDERREVRDYLKRIWGDNNCHCDVEVTYATVKREAELILAVRI